MARQCRLFGFGMCFALAMYKLFGLMFTMPTFWFWAIIAAYLYIRLIEDNFFTEKDAKRRKR
jgi:hypothetical protein